MSRRIDCHVHLVRIAKLPQVERFRKDLLVGSNPGIPEVSDEDIARESAPLVSLMDSRSTTGAFASTRAAAMATHVGTVEQNARWADFNNELVLRACKLNPWRFAPVGMLGQSQIDREAVGKSCAQQMRKWIGEGFVGFNLDPDGTGGLWTGPSFLEAHNYPIFGVADDAGKPIIVHASESINPQFPHTAVQYLIGDMIGVVHLMMHGKKLRQEFKNLRFVVPHGGGPLACQKGRWTALAKKNDWMTPDALFGEGLLFVDSCLYRTDDMAALFKAVPRGNVLFGSECDGAFPGVINDETGLDADHTACYLGEVAFDSLPPATVELASWENAQRVYTGSNAWIR